MPLKKHRRHVKIHDNCFTASEAIDWLHSYLQNNHYFGPHVTRNQTMQLLKKFYKSDVFQDVGKKKCNNKFVDDHRLYRFTPIPTTPQKNAKSNVRTPLAVINARHFAVEEQRLEVKPLPTTPSKVPSPKIEIPTSNIHPNFAILLWKKLVFRRLMSLLGVITLDGILDSRNVSGQTVLHNMTRLDDNGVVAITDKSDDFPHWILLAMKCLARWPNASGSGSCLPNYPGFAIDVFQVVKEYLLNQSEPLIPRDLYKLFLSILYSVPSFSDYISASESRKCECLVGPVRTSEANLKTSTPVTVEGVSTGKNQLECTSISEILGRTRQGHENANSRPVQNISNTQTGSIVSCASSSHLGSGSLCHMPKQTLKSRIRRSVSLPKLDHQPYEMAQVYPWDDVDREIHTSMPVDLQTVGNPTRDLSSLYYSNYQEIADLAFINSYDSSYHTAHSSSQMAIKDSSQDLLQYPEPYSYGIHKSQKKFDSDISDSLSSGDEDSTEPQCRGIHNVNLQRENCNFINDLAASQNALHEEKVFSRREFEFSAKGGLKQYSGISDNVPNARCQKCCRTLDVLYGYQLELVEMLQVATLLLCPSERRKVHSMLQLFQKMSRNQSLVLHSQKPVKILLVDTFSFCILRAKEERGDDDRPAAIITAFLIDHVDEVFTPPTDLRKDFEALCRLHTEKEKMRYGRDISGGVTYCKQVSQKTYEEQKFSASKHALSQLLRDIVRDPHLTDRDRHKKLKQFKENHPEVYLSQFPHQSGKIGEQKIQGRINLISRIRNFRL